MTEGQWVCIFVSAVAGVGCAIIIAYLKDRNRKALSVNTFEMNLDKWDYIKAAFMDFDTKLIRIENLLRTLNQDFSFVVNRRYHDEPVTVNRRQ